jgi:Xaa-Pro aminopeptidase
MSLPFDVHAARRTQYLSRLHEASVASRSPHAALLFGGHPPRRNGDTEYRYRPCSDLHYLTGWEDPEVVALFRPGAEHPFVLFVQPKDPAREVWTGVRPGVPGALAAGADLAYPVGELDARLGELLQGYGVLHVRLGEDAARDARVFRASSGSARAAARNGLEVPHTYVDPRRLLGEMRLVKSDEEIALLRTASMITCEAHRNAMRVGSPGAWEYEVESAVDHTFRRHGGNGPGYTTIVGGGANACILHYVTNREALRDGDLCLVDAGCEYHYYTADVTRTWPVNGRFSPAQRAVYEIVLAAQEAAIDRARVGVPYREMHDAAVRVLTQGLVDLGILDGRVDELIAAEAYKAYYMHGTGHWLGMDVHDAGAYWLGFQSRALAPGMVLTVEPGLYLPPDDPRVPEPYRGIGIRIEDDVLVTTSGPDVLTADCPKSVEDLEAICDRRGRQAV